MKLRIITFIFLLLAPFIAGAQDKIENDGGPGMLFSGIVRDPVSLAMGGTVAVPDGSSAYAAFSNPTAMWMMESGFQAGASYMIFSSPPELQTLNSPGRIPSPPLQRQQ